MSRATRGQAIHGVVLLDKPEGLSSNQALQIVRRLFNARKAGHTGSLDPFATGMLPLCLGEATKTAGYLLDADKSYEATMMLGQATDTGDTEGHVVETLPVPPLERRQVRAVLESFVGEIDQVPPMYSALKYKGQPLYALARAGKTVHREPRRVVIHSIELREFDAELLRFSVRCSKGTYIRTLSEDIGRKLETCAHLVALRRNWVQPFEQAGMVGLDELRAAAEAGDAGRYLLPLDAGLRNWPACELPAGSALRFSQGNSVKVGTETAGWHRVRGPGGAAIGLGEVDSEGVLHPRRVFHFPAE